MTRKNIARSISEDLGVTQLETKKVVQMVFGAIVQSLLEDDRVELRSGVGKRE